MTTSHIESEFDDIAVVHHVILAFDPQLPSLAGFRGGAEFDEVVVVNDFCSDETSLEISVNHASGLGCLVTGADCPGAGFFFRLWSDRSADREDDKRI